MKRTFVELQNGRLRRENNSFDGPGRDHWSNPMATHERRGKRRRQAMELTALVQDPDNLESHDVTDQEFYGSDNHRLTIRHNKDTGQLAFASFGGRGGRRRRSNRAWN